MLKSSSEWLNYKTKIESTKLSHLQGAFYMFTDFSSYYGSEVEGLGDVNDSESLCIFLLEKAQVWTGNLFYMFFCE